MIEKPVRQTGITIYGLVTWHDSGFWARHVQHSVGSVLGLMRISALRWEWFLYKVIKINVLLFLVKYKRQYSPTLFLKSNSWIDSQIPLHTCLKLLMHIKVLSMSRIARFPFPSVLLALCGSFSLVNTYCISDCDTWQWQNGQVLLLPWCVNVG